MKINVQLFGGRGASSSSSGTNSAKEDPMNVPYDEWGEKLDGFNRTDLYDDEGNRIGKIEDREVYIEEPDIRKATLKDVKEDIKAWKMDDGTYGDMDVSIFLQYDDGTHWTNDMDAKPKFSKVVGASISTGDYEMVAGYEILKGKKVPIQTWSEDGESGYTNSYSGYKTAGTYFVREKITYNNYNEKRDRYYTKYETIRKSQIKWR